MTEPSKIQKVIGKIQQLRKISESTHSKAEKETTIALAAKLIAEYQLSEAEIAVKANVDEHIDLDSESIIYESGKLTPWKGELAVGLAELNGLFIYNSPVRNASTHRTSRRYRVIGRRSDVEIALYMMQYLTSTIQELVGNYVPGGKKRGVNPERENWCLGCVRGFMAKMRAEREKVNQASTSAALVFIGNKAKEAEDAWKAKTGITLRRSNYRSHAQFNYNTYNSGFSKGQTLTVNAGMGAGTDVKKLGG